MKKQKPSEDWLRIAAEARSQIPPPPDAGSAPAWFVTRALARRRAAARPGLSAWFALPGLGRAATLSTVLAVACAVLVLSTGGLTGLTDAFNPDAELEELDLP